MKTFVIDTNVLIYDPQAIFQFGENRVVLPITVLEELDKLKRVPGDLGKNSREIVRILDSLKGRGEGTLHEGVHIINGPKIFITTQHKDSCAFGLSPQVQDNKIIMAAYLHKEQGEHVVFVSKDLAARVKAESLGIESRDYENLKVAYESLSTGIQKVEIEKQYIDLFYKDGCVQIPPPHQLLHNEYCILSSLENSSAVGIYQNERLHPLIKSQPAWGIKPRNVEQKCALDLLLRQEVQLICLTGPAGTGKTLITLASALKQVFDTSSYSKILVSRPIVPLGRDIGYLPGSKEEKLYHWMQPIYDNLEYLCNASNDESSETLKWVMESKKIEMEAVTYIRGRSLPKMFIIVDEAQNLTPHEAKTIISRAGEGTKVVFTGDPSQIDNPYLDKDSNGLTYTISRFSNQPIFGHIFLQKTERSELAAISADLM